MLPQTDPLRTVAAPLLAEIKAGLATEPRASERVGLLLRLARAEKLVGDPAEVKKALDKAVALARQVLRQPSPKRYSNTRRSRRKAHVPLAWSFFCRSWSR